MVTKWDNMLDRFMSGMAITSVLKFCCGWEGGRVPDINATSDPRLTTEADFSSLKFVNWDQVSQ